MVLGFIGLLGSLALMIYLTMRGVNLLIAAPFAAFIAAILSGITIFPQLAAEGVPDFITSYMGGFTGFISSWWLMFLAGAIFGKVMEDSGAADSVSKWIIEKIGAKHAILAVVFACAVLTYGGVSLFIVAFSVFPMALSLFKEANLPRRFIPAALALGSVTFTMTSAGSPEIQNWIPIQHLGTTPYAGWQVSLIVAIFMAVAGYFWLKWMVNRAVAKGEKFVAKEADNLDKGENRALPSPLLSLLPLIVVLGFSFIFHEKLGTSALIIALLGGIITTYLISFKYMQNRDKAIAEGALGAVIAIANTAAVVGYGGVVKQTEAFLTTVDYMTNIPGSPLIGGAIAVAVLAGLTGSSSGGQSIALPLIAPHYLDMGVNPEQLHRVIAIASGSLDTLPHSGYVVTTITAIAQESHKDAYPAMGALTVIIPLLGTILAIILFSLGL
ncbi:GntP family permease [Ureibacillus thermosphaericus]|uniref:GntP family permease n=1 Tax=Ureibacillus thermosphaericus TaxID=51173 RepID=UPI000BBCCE96|nr:SLC13 family permease [Ureibacillus thermosphaericus]